MFTIDTDTIHGRASEVTKEPSPEAGVRPLDLRSGDHSAPEEPPST